MFVVLSIQHALRMRHIVICSLSGSTIYFFNINLTNGKILEMQVIELEMWILIFYKTFVFWEEVRKIWSKMYIGFHVKHPLFLSGFNKLEFLKRFFEKYSNIKFHENPSSGSRVVPCGRKDGQT